MLVRSVEGYYNLVKKRLRQFRMFVLCCGECFFKKVDQVK